MPPPVPLNPSHISLLVSTTCAFIAKGEFPVKRLSQIAEVVCAATGCAPTADQVLSNIYIEKCSSMEAVMVSLVSHCLSLLHLIISNDSNVLESNLPKIMFREKVSVVGYRQARNLYNHVH